MWNTLEESFEQVGHTLELTVVGEGNINLKDSKISLKNVAIHWLLLKTCSEYRNNLMETPFGQRTCAFNVTISFLFHLSNFSLVKEFSGGGI